MGEPRCCQSSSERSYVGNYNKFEDFDPDLAFATTSGKAAEVWPRGRNAVDIVPVGFWIWSRRSIKKQRNWVPDLSTAELYCN